MARGVYFYTCPNCGGPTGDDRLLARLPCPKCLGERVAVESIVEVYDLLQKNGRLRKDSELALYARVEQEARRVEELFEKAMSSRLWSAQRMWVRRVLKGKSFAIIAPTGVGKTTFGVLMAIYFASKGEKSYIVLPTTPLVTMVEEKARKLAKAAGVPARILAIHSKLKTRERRERLERLLEADFDILITTSRFLISKLDVIKDVAKKFNGFRFVFVDDVDAVLKSGRSVDAVLQIVGFTEEDIKLGLEMLRLQRELARLPQKPQKVKGKTQSKVQAQSTNTKGRVEGGEQAGETVEEQDSESKDPWKELEELRKKIEEVKKKASVLVVSSATGRPRGARVRLFRVLLDFEAGSGSETLRNIVDAYTFPEHPSKLEDKVAKIVERIGDGGLVYVPIDKGVEYAEKLAELLRNRGIAAEAFTSKNYSALERFRRGETSVLVGVAIYYGVAVRGLDLPERIRYAVFAGVPRLKFSAKFEDPHPVNVLRALGLLVEYGPKDVSQRAEELLARLRRIVQRLSQAALARLAEELRSGKLKSPYANTFLEAVKFIREALRREDVWRGLEEAPDIAITREDGKAYILIPDVATYIQASGRTSRLYAGGITKGLSVVVADNDKLLEGLIRRTRWWVEAEWKRFEELDLPKLLREIDEDRGKVRAVIEGRVKPSEVRELVKTALMVVESPNKARTIASFFGRPSSRQIGPLRVYEVSTGDYVLLITASGGHVYDLVKPVKPIPKIPENWLMDMLQGTVEGVNWRQAVNVQGVIYDGENYLPVYGPILRCTVCGNQWTLNPAEPSGAEKCPRCGSSSIKSSWETIKALRDLASEVDVVLIGTDPDTEGEKIGWDVASLLAPMAKSVARIEFHEVTRKAILEALRNPRPFKESLVEAQIVRRVEDRWIGFTLSPILWLDFWPKLCKMALSKYKKLPPSIEKCKELSEKPNYNLSAGRVQTPVLGWIVDRYEKYRETLQRLYRLVLENNLVVELLEKDIGKVKRDELLGEKVEVEVVDEGVEEVKPLPPYTTDTMLSDATSKLRLGAPEVMRLAQDLFELGFITYHRTDSIRVSEAGIAVAKEYLKEVYGDRYREVFVPRQWGVGGAHEAIRPTRPIDVKRLRQLIEEGVIQPVRPLTRYHYALYDLVFRRFIASQMRAGKVLVKTVRVRVKGVEKTLELRTKIVEPGFLEFYQPFRIDPDVESGVYRIVNVSIMRWSPYPPYTQADVVRLMKERGIGRPSTYAKIIETLLRRRYITQIARQGYLASTVLGKAVYKFLTSRFARLVSEETTRRLQEEMDKIEEGLRDYREVLKEILEEIRSVPVKAKEP